MDLEELWGGRIGGGWQAGTIGRGIISSLNAKVLFRMRERGRERG
jgi:hypothetical protein